MGTASSVEPNSRLILKLYLISTDLIILILCLNRSLYDKLCFTATAVYFTARNNYNR